MKAWLQRGGDFILEVTDCLPCLRKALHQSQTPGSPGWQGRTGKLLAMVIRRTFYQFQPIVDPSVLHSRYAILSTPSLPPSVPGVYAWFFRDIPGSVPVDGCVTKDSLTLLYIGISPDKIGKPNSRQHLRRRITTHFQGNAEGSTLRRSLGVLLAGESGYPLRRVGSGKRMTLTHSGEQWLDDWMTENAFVCWLEHQAPWEFEDELIGSLSLPLNIKG